MELPSELLGRCNTSHGEIKTNGDLATGYLDAVQALLLCDNDKRLLRVWEEDRKKGE